jgi:hypothetical protein
MFQRINKVTYGAPNIGGLTVNDIGGLDTTIPGPVTVSVLTSGVSILNDTIYIK